MIVYCYTENNLVYQVEKESEYLNKYNFTGNYEHLKNHPYMYKVQGDTIVIDETFENRKLEAEVMQKLAMIRDKRKPLFKAYDTLEMKRILVIRGDIPQGEYPFIDSMSDERWQEIKEYRNKLRELTNDLEEFPETPTEIKYFL